MAYKKIELKDGITPVSSETFEKFNDGIYDNQNIEIIAISETEPQSYNVGDRYFNTLSKKIYVATDSGFSEIEEPIRGAFYLILSEQSSYYYDGNEMISVGGGTEDIIIQDEQPTTDDWKIFIDTGEINNMGSEVVNSLEGNETELAPSVKAVNDANSCMTICINGNNNISVATAWTSYNVPLTITNYNKGTSFSYSDNGIKIEKGIHHIKVSGNSNLRGISGIRVLSITKNNGAVSTGYDNRSTATDYGTISLAPRIIEVNENDIIRLTITANATGTMTIAGNAYTYLTAEVVD